MDTLFFKKLSEISIVQDSILAHNHRIEQAIAASKPSLLLQLLPFIGVIVGGIIAYAGQTFIKNKEFKILKSTTISTTINKIFSNLTCLTFYLKELAYLEVDSKYQYYLSITVVGKLKERALEEHYADYKYIAELKSKVAVAVAEIDSSFSSYYRLNGKELPDNTATTLNTFANQLVNLRHHDGFDESENVQAEQIQEQMDELFKEYNSSILAIRQLASALS